MRAIKPQSDFFPPMSRDGNIVKHKTYKLYLSTVCPVLEYTLPVWQTIPIYLSNVIERVQKRAHYIIYPETKSYVHALQLGELDSLDNRQDYLCKNI